MSREAPIVRNIQLAASALRSRLFRNTVGTAVLGSSRRISKDGLYQLKDGDVVVPHGRITQVGLPAGSADLIGWREVDITPDMVGKTIAQFTSCEVKKPKGSHTSEDQKRWRDVTMQSGACSGIVRSIEEAETLLRSKPASATATAADNTGTKST